MSTSNRHTGASIDSYASYYPPSVLDHYGAEGQAEAGDSSYNLAGGDSTTHRASRASAYSKHKSSVLATLGGSGAPKARKSAYGGTRRRTLWVLVGLALLVACILAGVLGGVLGSRSHNKSKDNTDAANLAGGTTVAVATGVAVSSVVAADAVTTDAATTDTATADAAAVSIAPLATWDWSTNKSIGVCLGNWLILEKWMDPTWFNATASPDAVDEWTFVETLGANATAALQEHYRTWITQADILFMYQHGINHLRVPMGYWSWIAPVSGEPYVNAGELEYLTNLLSYAYELGMYVLIDLHGLPGSQNGEESSGHLTESPSWFGNSTMRDASLQTVQAVMDYVAASPYRSVISGIEVINEPRPYTEEQNQMLLQYYESAYQLIQNTTYPIPMFFHDGFTNFTYYYDFASSHATTPPSLVIEDHPYPGNFPPQNNSADILNQVCSAANRYLEYPVPVCITEWSIYTGVKEGGFEREFYEAQLTAWSWSAGGMYWSYKVIPADSDVAAGTNYTQYSFLAIANATYSDVQEPSAFGYDNTTTLANAAAYLQSLASNCGTVPADVAPYSNGSFTVASWDAQASALATATITEGDVVFSTATDGVVEVETQYFATPTARMRQRRRDHQA